jgi:hypothetical protein
MCVVGAAPGRRAGRLERRAESRSDALGRHYRRCAKAHTHLSVVHAGHVYLGSADAATISFSVSLHLPLRPPFNYCHM